VIYTSGSTGRPKGVEVSHASICNFIAVASQVYRLDEHDRVYQGMTLAFDFAMEEVWPTWHAGATLVAGPVDGRVVGAGLREFLAEERITFLHAVPTVLATVDRALPLVRTVNLGGEACPPELVDRWAEPGRRILNTYGPTEATASCTYAELQRGAPITIGRPLPTYKAILLGPSGLPVPAGEIGELCIAGVGLAVGYLNRPELTAEKFVELYTGDRVYRTGDLARLLATGNLEYLGRVDAEVKVRGHRVDLGEIESLLLQDAAVQAAVVALVNPEAHGGQLAAYVVLAVDGPAAGEVRQGLLERLRGSLPSYMVPAYLDFIDRIPTFASGKADRRALPAPRTRQLLDSGVDHIPPETSLEAFLEGPWCEALHVPDGSVSVTANLFSDLGGHSLVAATLVSALRADGRHGCAGLSVPDLYRNPSIRDLAAHLAANQDAAAADPVLWSGAAPVSGRRVWAFGAAQLGWLYLVGLVTLLPLGLVFRAAGDSLDAAFAAGAVATLVGTWLAVRWVLPVLVARLLGPGLRPGSHPLYGRTHLQAWIVMKAIGASPLRLLAASPWATAYLRWCGAHLAPDAHIGTAEVQLPSLLRVGRGAAIGHATHLVSLTVRDGRVQLGTVDIGAGAVVGANAVLEGPCRVGDRAVLGVQSSLAAGRVIPDRTSWAGSPAAPSPSGPDPLMRAMLDCRLGAEPMSGRLQSRWLASAAAIELLPIVAGAPVVLLPAAGWMSGADTWAAVALSLLAGPVFVLFACFLVLMLRHVLLHQGPGATFRASGAYGLVRAHARGHDVRIPAGVYHERGATGLRKWCSDKLMETGMTLVHTMYATLYVPHWLRLLGAEVGRRSEVSTITNIDPGLLAIGDESFIADLASVGAAVYANGHVALRHTSIGSRTFVGNAAFVPAGEHLGSGSLLGVVSVPPAAGIPADTSWLGSPPIFLPNREVYEGFSEADTFNPTRRRVIGRYAIELLRVTMPASLAALALFGGLSALADLATSGLPLPLVVLALPVVPLGIGLALTLGVAGLKWLIVGRYRPRVEPLWSAFVRRTELVTGLYEAVAVPALLGFLTGTPMLNPLLRLFGARVGERALLDTTFVTEFDLVHVEADAYVARHVSLQTHLFEDRVMKMDRVHVRRGARIGTRSVVLYGSSVGEWSRLEPLTLVMKGETVPDRTAWTGVPAQPDHAPAGDSALLPFPGHEGRPAGEPQGARLEPGHVRRALAGLGNRMPGVRSRP
jgi:non-ribosomal peptide synthetase-like protein